MTRPPKATRLLNRSLMHTAARLHYLDGLSQLEVSRRMEVSTATVSRLLGLARDEGIVRIQVVDLDDADVLGEKLAAALALKAVRVIDGARAAALSAEVGALLLGAGLAPGAVRVSPAHAAGGEEQLVGIAGAGAVEYDDRSVPRQASRAQRPSRNSTTGIAATR